MDKLLGGGVGSGVWCMERKGRGYYKVQGIKGDHLYAHTEGTKELNLVLRDELGKCDENGGLECRLTVVVHVISDWGLETDTRMYVCCVGREWIAADVQEAFIAKDGILEPAESQCDSIGDCEGYRDEFEGFDGTPKTFKVTQTGREEQEGQ